MINRISFFYMIVVFFFSLICYSFAGAFVIHSGKEYYIEDRTGERWNVTQAKSAGFEPERFQYGIGKHAFTPLDDSSLADDTTSVFHNPRIIGVADEEEAKAYSIPKLRHHEIANTRIGSIPIVAGY